MFTKKIQGHPIVCVSTPPSRTPMEAPPEMTKPQMPIARARSLGSLKVVMMMERAAGAMTAPPTPCKARAATSTAWLPASPHSSEAKVKRARPAANTRLRPKRSPALPPSSRKPPKVSRYPLTTHESPVSEKASEPCIAGSATLTMVPSSTIMSCAAHTSSSASHLRSIGSRLRRDLGSGSITFPSVIVCPASLRAAS